MKHFFQPTKCITQQEKDRNYKAYASNNQVKKKPGCLRHSLIQLHESFQRRQVIRPTITSHFTEFLPRT